MEFKGRDEFLEISNYGLDNPDEYSWKLSEFKVSEAWYPMWSLALAEAEAAFKLSTEQR